MSGGHFYYDQYKIGRIADEIERIVEINDSEELDRWGDEIGYGFDSDIIERFREGIKALRIAEVYAQRIDWLLSGDDGEDNFKQRLQEELNRLGETDE